MGAGTRRLRRVAHAARVQRAGVALPGDELNGVIGLPAGCDGVGAVVARLAIDAAVLFGHAIQRLILLEAAAVTGGVVAARLMEPWVGVLRDRLHAAATVMAIHSPLGHYVAQTLGLGIGVATSRQTDPDILHP